MMPLSTTVDSLPSKHPESYTTPPSHHVGNPPTSFVNPWPSYNHTGGIQILKARWFSNTKNYVPVPTDKSQLVPVRKPNFNNSSEDGLKATWFGHASFLIELSGMKILCDPVWSQKVGPYGVVGPSRFTDIPCIVGELPEVDAVLISHDHYDHLDSATLAQLVKKQEGNLRFFCGVGGRSVLVGLGIGIEKTMVTEMDWWDRTSLKKRREDKERGGGEGGVELVCTPAQHNSGRTPWNMQSTLWCSWIIQSITTRSLDSFGETDSKEQGGTREMKKVFFAGDTGYCYVPEDTMSSHHGAPTPPCPAFAEIGSLYGPFDLALLPIGCYSPRKFLSTMHSSPEDAVAIHKDVRSKKSIGMHYGAFRGGISAHYEPVTEPPERFRKAAEKEGLKWGEEVGLCGIGETVVV